MSRLRPLLDKKIERSEFENRIVAEQTHIVYSRNQCLVYHLYATKMVYYYNSIIPSKEAFDTRPFPSTTSSLKKVFEDIKAYAYKKHINGQLIIKKNDTKEYIDFNGMYDLEEQLKSLNFDETQIQQVWLYRIGFFTA